MPPLAPLRQTLLALVIALQYACGSPSSAADAQYEATVHTSRVEERQLLPDQPPVPTQVLTVLIGTGPRRGEVVQAEAQRLAGQTGPSYRAGDHVIVQLLTKPSGEEWIVVDAVRVGTLYWIAGLFAGAVLLVAGRRGLSSLLGLAVSFAVLVLYVLPRLLAGWSPILVSVTGATLILVVTIYLTHGRSRMTSIAIASTAISLVITALLGAYALEAAHLTGLSEEALFVQQNLLDQRLDLRGLLLAGVIIGALGVLDDITVTQTSVVFALHHANAEFGWRELFERGMTVGRDHIASLVNTLAMAYVGAGLPLLLLFTTYQVPFAAGLNSEVIAEEVVRTLVGSLGLVAAVPITTLLAALVAAQGEPTRRDSHGEGGP